MSIHKLSLGELAVGTSFTKFMPYEVNGDSTQGIRATFKANKGNVFVAALIGIQKKTDEIDPVALLNKMGWVHRDTLPKVLTDREQFEEAIMDMEHGVLGWLSNDYLKRGDNGDDYADEYVHGLWEGRKIWPVAEGSANPDDRAVNRFAEALKRKMENARGKGREGWDDPTVCDNADFTRMFFEHLAKTNEGNYLDLANFLMMLHQRDAEPGLLAAELAKVKRDAAAPYEVALEKMRPELYKFADFFSSDDLRHQQLSDLACIDPLAPTETCPCCHGTFVVPLNQKDHDGEWLEGHCPNCQP